MPIIFQSFTIIHLLHQKLLKTGRRVHIPRNIKTGRKSNNLTETNCDKCTKRISNWCIYLTGRQFYRDKEKIDHGREYNVASFKIMFVGMH